MECRVRSHWQCVVLSYWTQRVGPEPVCAAMNRGHSLRMDNTVRELMEHFLQSPLVAWVSAPASLSHGWWPGSSPASWGLHRPHPGPWQSWDSGPSQVSKLKAGSWSGA